MVHVVTIFFSLFAVASAYKTLPEKFYGNYDIDHSENFDEYLAAKGYGWLTRRLVTLATFKKEFKKNAAPGKFDYANLTSKKNVFYNDIVLGQPFIGDGLESKKQRVTFDLVGNVLYEKHENLGNGGDADIYEYSFVNQSGKEYLLVKVEANGVVAKRFYRRI